MLLKLKNVFVSNASPMPEPRVDPKVSVFAFPNHIFAAGKTCRLTSVVLDDVAQTEQCLPIAIFEYYLGIVMKKNMKHNTKFLTNLEQVCKVFPIDLSELIEASDTGSSQEDTLTDSMILDSTHEHQIFKKDYLFFPFLKQSIMIVIVGLPGLIQYCMTPNTRSDLFAIQSAKPAYAYGLTACKIFAYRYGKDANNNNYSMIEKVLR